MTQDAPGAEVTAQDVCVIVGPGRLECWACPVRECAFWQNPAAALSPQTQEVALRAARKIIDGSTHTPIMQAAREAGPADTAFGLMVDLTNDVTQANVRAQMAAEAAWQGLLTEAVEKEKNRVTDRWAKGLGGRVPSPDDDADLDEALERAEATVAASHYQADPEVVLATLNYFRGRKVKGRRRAED